MRRPISLMKKQPLVKGMFIKMVNRNCKTCMQCAVQYDMCNTKRLWKFYHPVIAETNNAPNNAWTNNLEKNKLNTSLYGDCYFWPIVVVLFSCVIVGTGTPSIMALPDWTVYLFCFASVCGGVYICRVFKCARISAWKKGLMARTEKPLFWIA